MQPGVGLADFDGSYDVGVQDTCAVLGFAHETRDRSTVVPELFPENLQGYGAVAWMLGLVDRRRTAFANLTLYCVPGYL